MHFLAEIPIIKFCGCRPAGPDEIFIPVFSRKMERRYESHGNPVLNEIMRDTVVEVDLDRIAFNVRQIKAMAGPGTQVAAVVKADGYGHGAPGHCACHHGKRSQPAGSGHPVRGSGVKTGLSRLSRVNHGTDAGPSAALCAGIRHHPDH